MGGAPPAEDRWRRSGLSTGEHGLSNGPADPPAHLDCLFLLTLVFCVSQASGVTVNDEVIKVFNEMKVRKSQTPEEVKKRKKAVLFCMSDDTKKIIVEEGKQILQGEIGETVEDPYARFVSLLPLNDCRYGLYDATYETKESKKEDLVFIFWCSIQTISDLLRPTSDRPHTPD